MTSMDSGTDAGIGPGPAPYWGALARGLGWYGWTAVLVPGAVALAGLLAFIPIYGQQLEARGFTFGDLGVFLVLAYAAGQLVQALGELLEKVYWGFFWGGLPEDWARAGGPDVVPASQAPDLQNRLRALAGVGPDDALSSVSRSDWDALKVRIGLLLRQARLARRLHSLSRTYRLLRGLVAALLILLILGLLSFLTVDQLNWQVKLLIVICLIPLAIYRMHRSGVAYARELWSTFLLLPPLEAGSEEQA